jgi:hypothetical protein
MLFVLWDTPFSLNHGNYCLVKKFEGGYGYIPKVLK